MGENAERAVPSEVLLAKAVSKWADTVTWLLLSSGLATLVPDHMRSTLREECERIRDIANDELRHSVGSDASQPKETTDEK